MDELGDFSDYSDYSDYSNEIDFADYSDTGDFSDYNDFVDSADFSDLNYDPNQIYSADDIANYDQGDSSDWFSDPTQIDSNYYDEQGDGSYDVYDQDGNYLGNVDEEGNLTDEPDNSDESSQAQGGGGGSISPNKPKPPKNQTPKAQPSTTQPLTKKQIIDLIKSTANQGYTGSNSPQYQQPVTQAPDSGFLNTNTLLLAFAAFALGHH